MMNCKLRSLIIETCLLMMALYPGHLIADETTITDANKGVGVPASFFSGKGIVSAFGSVDGGVNLFSGDAAISIPLLSLSGRGGLDFSLSLNYSSNVHLLLNTENQYQQASWIGAGWMLSFGAIIANLHETKDYLDDEFYFFNGSNLTKIIKYDPGNYTLENNPYWKIVPTIVSGKIVGWTITDESGKIFEYGDFQNGFGTKKANRCVLHWGNWVGNGRTTGEDWICYQWDISRIVDPAGSNEINFYYYQEQANLPNPVTKVYTRASYPDYVIDTVGRKIKFTLNTRDTNEWQNFLSSYQISKYETQFLKKIEVFESTTASTPYTTIEFNHTTTGSDNKIKRLLTSITVKDAQLKALPPMTFEYVPAGSANAGALKKITYPEGGSKTFTYKAQSNSYLNQEGDQLLYVGGTQSNQEILFKNSGNTFAYIDKDDGQLRIWKWIGEWYYYSVNISTSYLNDDTRLAAADKHVAYYLTATNYQKLSVLSWDNQQNTWIETDGFTSSTTG